MNRKRFKLELPQLQKNINDIVALQIERVEKLSSSFHAFTQFSFDSDTSAAVQVFFTSEKMKELLAGILTETQSMKEDLSNFKKECGHAIRSLDKEIREIESRAYSFQKLYEVGLAVSSELELQRIMELGMEAAIEITGAKRGYIALIAPQGGVDFLVAKDIDNPMPDDAVYEVSKTIIEEVIQTKTHLEIDDAVDHENFGQLKSVEGFRLRSILCVPLESDGNIIGVIYLDNKESGGIFSTESVSIIKAFARQIAIALKKGLDVKEMRAIHDSLMDSLRREFDFSSIIGKSEKLCEVLEIVSQVADTSANVLVQGESGTGKELIACALHANSSRKGRPFIVVNAAAIPEHLLESELFGFEKNAFTGATTSKPGKFELANTGTLFLDEIGDMSLVLQAKLLRAIQQKVIERLGGVKSIPVDIRIIAATNRDIPSMIREKTFREDLFYRLNVVTITLPPLRERKADIALLANHFLQKFIRREKKTIAGISPRAMVLLEQYEYPGNARQLENTIERAVILCNDEYIFPNHLPPEMQHDGESFGSQPNSFTDMLNDYKKTLIRKTLEETGNNKSEAVKRLGLSRSYFYELLHELGLR